MKPSENTRCHTLQAITPPTLYKACFKPSKNSSSRCRCKLSSSEIKALLRPTLDLRPLKQPSLIPKTSQWTAPNPNPLSKCKLLKQPSSTQTPNSTCHSLQLHPWPTTANTSTWTKVRRTCPNRRSHQTCRTSKHPQPPARSKASRREILLRSSLQDRGRCRGLRIMSICSSRIEIM